MRIYNNIPALQSLNFLSKTGGAIQKSIAKLSSGLRINSAADDAAGLAISEKMRAQINGLDRAVKNSQDGISMIQTAEGALQETTSILQRMRELSVQSANDTLTQQDRGYIQLEIDQLKEEINRISSTTQFNKKKLLDGSASVLWSSDSLDTRLLVRGGLLQIDQFGQKNIVEGNYKVSINANPGAAEVQKTDIFKIKHKNVLSDLKINTDKIGTVKVDNLPAGNYTVTGYAQTFVPEVGDVITTEMFFTSGTTFSAGTTFAIGTKFGVDASFSAGNAFDSGASFISGAAFMAGSTFIVSGIFLSGSSFDAGSRFLAGASFAAGSTFDIGATFSGGTKFVAGARFGATTVFSAGSTFGNGSTFSDGDSFDAGSIFANGATFGANTEFFAGSFGATTEFGPGANFATGTLFTGGNVAVIAAGTIATGSIIGTATNGAFILKAGTIITMGAAIGVTLTGDMTIAQISTLTSNGGALSAATGPISFVSTMTLTNNLSIDGADTVTRVRFTTVATVQGAYTAVNNVTLGTGGGTLADVGTLSGSGTLGTGGGTLIGTGTLAGNGTLASDGTLAGTGGTLAGAGGTLGSPLGVLTGIGTLGVGGGTLINVPGVLAGGGGMLTNRGTLGAGGGIVGGTVGPGTATVAVTGATSGNGGAVLNSTGVLSADYTASRAMMINNPPTGYLSKYSSSLDYDVVIGSTIGLNVTNLDQAGVKIRVEFIRPVKVYQAFGLTTGVGLARKYGLGIATNNSTFSGTANILLEVKNIDTVSKIVTFKAVAQVLFVNGVNQSFVLDELQIKEGEGAQWTAFGITGDVFSLENGAIAAAGYSVGDKMTIGIMKSRRNDYGSFASVSATQNTDWEGSWADKLHIMKFAMNSAVNGKDVHFRSFYLNTVNGSVYESDILVPFNNDYGPTTTLSGETFASFEATYIGQTARMDTQLRDLDKFWDVNGRFLLTDPQILTMTQGNGTKTNVTLYATDTIHYVQSKLNSAIAFGLGQANFLDNSKANSTNNFVSFVVDETKNTSESVGGTYVIRSVVNGQNGTISFSGDEDLINALSLNVIQEAKENRFNISIQDAHSGKSVVSNQNISGNVAVGLLHSNLDFEFRSNANMSTVWNEISKNYDTAANIGSHETIIHIASNNTVFQIGANEGEDMGIDIADMSTRALGVHKVLVTDRESAARSITIIDNAIDRVSVQRAKLGAYQNRLEHTINNLTVAGENLTASESRIRDLDVAKEMMTFTKLNILAQVGNSMLGQANQLPQNILALLR